MKKAAIALSLAAIILSLVSLSLRSFERTAELEAVKAAQEPVITLYARTAKITEVDYGTDTVTLVDGAGRLWSFTGCEDYDVGDFVSLLMSDAGTPESVLDDVIVSARYAGFWD